MSEMLLKSGLKPETIVKEMERIGVDPRGITIMSAKFEHFVLKLYGISQRQAAILKQEMLARGAEAAVPWKVCSWAETNRDQTFTILLAGTRRQYEQLIDKLKLQPFGLKRIAERIESVLTKFSTKPEPLLIKGTSYDLFSRTFLMGIINLTPDSFSKDGLYARENPIDAALEQAEAMIAAGADFLDLGAESTRPGSFQVSAEEELKRMLPVLKELSREVAVPISVDTYKPEVAKAALAEGASIINDIWGLQAPDDPEHLMAKLAGESGAPVIIMHNQAQPGYQDLISEMIEFFESSIELALKNGVKPNQIILDPGIGFAKSLQDNLSILNNLDHFTTLGYPILIGTSRKSVIGLTLNLPVEERLEGTIATNVWGIAKGANIVRVHDVKAISRAIRMCDAIKTE